MPLVKNLASIHRNISIYFSVLMALSAPILAQEMKQPETNIKTGFSLFYVCGILLCKDEPIDAAFEQDLATELNELIFILNDRTTSTVNVSQCTITIKLDYNKNCSQWGDLAKNVPNSTTQVISMKDIQGIRYFRGVSNPARSTYFFDFKSGVVQHFKDAREIQRRRQQSGPKVIETNDGAKLYLDYDSFKAAEYLFGRDANSYKMIGHCPAIGTMGVGSLNIFPYDMQISVQTPQSKTVENKLNRYLRYCNKH